MIGYAYALAHDSLTEPEQKTFAMFVLHIPALWVLAILARPYVWWRLLLVVAMPVLAVVGLQVPALLEYFEVEVPSTGVGVALGLGVAAAILLEVLWQVGNRLDEAGRFGHGRTLGIGPGRFEDPGAHP